MKSLLSYIIFTLTIVMLCIYVGYSVFIHTQAVEKEQVLTEACKTFLDTVTDKGALSERDYNVLVNQLGRTGASFDIVVTVDRLYAVPDAALGFVNEYRPAYAFSSKLGDFPSGVEGDAGYVPTQFFRKFDSLNLTVTQTTMMTYQTNQIRQMSLLPTLRTWTYTRGVRSHGNSIIDNEIPPINYDDPTWWNGGP